MENMRQNSFHFVIIQKKHSIPIKEFEGEISRLKNYEYLTISEAMIICTMVESFGNVVLFMKINTRRYLSEFQDLFKEHNSEFKYICTSRGS